MRAGIRVESAFHESRTLATASRGPVVFCLGVGSSEPHGLVIGLLVAVAWIALTSLAIPGRERKLTTFRSSSTSCNCTR
jgi:hypothetical protein